MQNPKINNRSICIISQYFPPDLNGDVTRLLNALRALKELSYKVTVVTAFPHYPNGSIPSMYKKRFFTKESWNGINVIRTFILPLPHKGPINRLLLYLSFTISSMFSIFLIGKVDTVWAFSQKLFSYFTGLIFKCILRTRLAIDLTDIWPEAIVNTGYMRDKSLTFRKTDLLLTLFFKLSDLVVTLTGSMKEMIVCKGVEPHKVVILPNIADSVDLTVKSTNLYKKEFDGKFVVMYLGNLGPNYDFKTLLDVASSINEESDDILFVIRGRGEMRDYIINYIKEKNMNNVYLDEKILSKGDLINYMSMADTFILPLRKCPYPEASFPIKLLDYLTCGRPILCCADGYLKELISKYNAGISIPPGDSNELKRAVKALKNSPELREEMARNARTLAKRLFCYNIFKKGIADIF